MLKQYLIHQIMGLIDYNLLERISSNDDKRLQTFDRIASYPYGTSAGKVCKTEPLTKVNIK